MNDLERLKARLAARGRNYSLEIYLEGAIVWDFGKMHGKLGHPVNWQFNADGKQVYVSSHLRAWWRLLGPNSSDTHA